MPSVETPHTAFEDLLVGLVTRSPKLLKPTLATLALQAPPRPPPSLPSLPPFSSSPTFSSLSSLPSTSPISSFDTWAAAALPSSKGDFTWVAISKPRPPVDPFANLLSAPDIFSAVLSADPTTRLPATPPSPRPIPVKRGDPSRNQFRAQLGALSDDLQSGESSPSSTATREGTTPTPAWFGAPGAVADSSSKRTTVLNQLDPFGLRRSPESVRPRARILSRPGTLLEICPSPPVTPAALQEQGPKALVTGLPPRCPEPIANVTSASPQRQPLRPSPPVFTFLPPGTKAIESSRSEAAEAKSEKSPEKHTSRWSSRRTQLNGWAHSALAHRTGSPPPPFHMTSHLLQAPKLRPDDFRLVSELLVQVVPKVVTIDNRKQSLAERIKAAKRAAAAEEVTDDDSDSETVQTSKGVRYAPRPRVETPVLEAPVPRPLGPKDAGTCGLNPFNSSPFSSPLKPTPQRLPRASTSRSSTFTPPSTFMRHPTLRLDSGSSLTGGGDIPAHRPLRSRISASDPLDMVRRRPQGEEAWVTPGLKYDGRGSAYARYSSQRSPRLSIPASALDGNNLQFGIMTSWKKAEPTDEQKTQLQDLLRTLTGLLNRRATVDNPTGGRYIVDVFGSVAWGGGTGKSGDVDLVIIDKHHPLGYEPHLWRTSPLQRVTVNSRRGRRIKNDKVPKIYNVHVLKQYLDDVSSFDCTKAVPAFTPIVKFDAPDLGLQFDICTNDLGGWYNSCLILAYCELSPFVLRPMIHVLKLWLESHNLNDPSGVKGPRTMSSYCITLMAIAYLQHIAVLPNLQSAVEVPASADPRNSGLENTVWLSWGKEQGDIAHIWFERHPPFDWVPATPGLTASEAVRGFFQFFSGWGSESFDPNTQLISLLNGGIISRRYPQAPGREHWVKLGRRFPGNDHVGKCDSYQCTDWDDQLLIVQDPFLWQKNCAKTLFIDKQEGRFFKHIATTHSFLEANPRATLSQLLRI